jgi:thiosulfate dehydrogenase
MPVDNNDKERISTAVHGLSVAIAFLLGVVAFLTFYIIFYTQPVPERPKPLLDRSAAVSGSLPADTFWHAPSIDNATDKQIIYGQKLIANTAEYFGPKGKVMPNAINGMNCQNCHLFAGTQVYGNNYGSVASTYPKYRARSGGMEGITKRINDCFERSLNGKALDTASTEMQAIVAYIKWLGKDVPKGKKAAGSGLKDVPYLDRAANPANGKLVYSAKCKSCHGLVGQGQMNMDGTGYTYPPLWGDHSFNTGAGLYRISNMAKFVKYNMPQGTTHKAPQLSDEEAWDVAAFVNSQPRPVKTVATDWPKINEKPFDHPFGPYVDGFSEEQHKFGPYKPIIDKIAALKKK